MRLSKLESGQRGPAKFFMLMASKASGAEMADVVKTFLYRPEFFGRAMVKLSAETMRGPSFWTAAEREYIALQTGKLHQTPYCIDIHTEMVRISSDGEIDAADADSARPELTAVLAFLEKVALSPEAVSESDLAEVRELGVPDEAIAEALHVNFVWNIVNRLSHSFDYRLGEGQLEKGTQALHQFKYKLPGFTTR
jgi:alkylhydroperoxidase family enzyme